MRQECDHDATVTVAAMCSFMGEGDLESASRVLGYFITDHGEELGCMGAVTMTLFTSALAVALEVGDPETFRALAGELAASEG